MRQLLAAFVISALASGCAELLPSTEPGTSGGGKYCNRARAEDEPACYPTEAQRVAAYHGEAYQAAEPAREAPIATASTQEAERRDVWQAEKEQKAAAETAAREERERKAAEWVAERDRKDAARAATALEVHTKALDKAYAGPAISAIMCSIEDEQRDLHEQLAREQRIAATGGVADLRARHEIAEQLVDDADELNGWRGALTRYGAARANCRAVAEVGPCRADLAKCDGQTHDIAAVWAGELNTLWGSDRAHPSR